MNQEEACIIYLSNLLVLARMKIKSVYGQVCQLGFAVLAGCICQCAEV